MAALCQRAHHSWRNLFALSFLLLAISYTNCDDEEPEGYMRREFSAVKPFGGHGLQYWELQGSAIATDDFLRLTPDKQSRQGALWNTVPCYARSWEMHIHFSVHGHSSRLFGDGFAFWYVRDRSNPGTVFGSKDPFSGLGIFFDTYSNHNGEHAHEHPYISAQINNDTVHYDHDSDGTHSAIAGCTSYFRGVDVETYAAVRYKGKEKRLTVQVDTDGEGKWRECFDVEGVSLPTGYHLGFSAATGELSDNHDILSVKFYELDDHTTEDEDPIEFSKITPHADGAAPWRERTEDVKSTFSPRAKKAFSWLTILFLLVVVIGGIGFYFYYEKQKQGMKRFY